MELFQEAEIEESFEKIGQLAEPFVRELRIVAGLPGRATMPLTGKRRDTKASRPTCDRLLDPTESLANMLHPPAGTPDVPDTVCAPEGLGPYLRVLWWFLADGEQVRAIAFPYEAGEHNLMGVVPPILAKRIDATWYALTLGRTAVIVEETCLQRLRSGHRSPDRYGKTQEAAQPGPTRRDYPTGRGAACVPPCEPV